MCGAATTTADRGALPHEVSERGGDFLDNGWAAHGCRRCLILF
jgi:hypothetical protein